MEQIINYFESLGSIQFIDILVAICIMTLFIVLSPSISYLIIKLVKLKSSKNKIKDSAFYRPLKVFFSILGIYLAVVFLKKSLAISDEVMTIVTKAFWIISTMAFSKALAQSFTPKSTLVSIYKDNTQKDINNTMLNFSLKVIRGIIYVIELLVILYILDINLGGVVASVGIGGVIITLAAQDTAKNIIAGIAMFVDRTFNVGDWIETPNYEGTVEEMTFRTTRIRNSENAIVNIPNSKLADTSVINWSKIHKRRYKVRLPFSFDLTAEQMDYLTKRITGMLEKNPDIINEDILLSFDKISDNGISLLIDIFVNTTNYDEFEKTKDKVNAKILDIVHSSGIKLSYPTNKVFIENEINRR